MTTTTIRTMSSVTTINVTACRSPPHWTIFAAHQLIKDVGQKESRIMTKMKLFPIRRRLTKNLRTKTHDLSIAKSQLKKWAKRNSTHHYTKPTQLRFYPGAWQDVLERAKEFYRLWVIKDCPFPVRECHLLQAHLCLEKAMEEFEKKGREVETGMSKYTFISHSHEYDQVILMSTSITCFFWSVIYFTIDFIFHLY